VKANRLARSLRLSLLASLGLVPLACAGSTRSNGGNGGEPPESGKPKPTCTSPVSDEATGIVTCSEGYRYRSRSGACPAGAADAAPAPAPGASPDPLPSDGFVDCTEDPSVCDEYLYGYCGALGEPTNVRVCESGCAADSDCQGRGGKCVCDSGAASGRCSYDQCDSDADCEAGYHCASYFEGCTSSRFVCQSPQDDCQECSSPASGQVCSLQPDGHRACGWASICGRPFLVDAKARVATTIRRGDWAIGELRPRLDHLSVLERGALAGHWTRLGQLEHASIAAFARFSLQLLALGAPPELIEACTQALGDETQHAKLCFHLASAYAGRPIGPGPLDIVGSLASSTLLDVVELVLLEGCFGETVAALEALDAAETATDPVIVAAYSQIARDEQRHAALAFRFVRWALQQDGAAVAERIAERLAQPHDSAARDVVVPCLQALLDAQRAKSAA
jgi:hypothetical protein